MSTGERIGELAREKGLNLHQLAVKAGVSYNTVYAIVKRGSERCSIENLKKIASILEIPWYELYADSTEGRIDAIKEEIETLSTGDLIRAARKKAGLTQRQLGELCGIAEPTIRRYELGKLNPKCETLQKIAKPLGVRWYELYQESEGCDDERRADTGRGEGD